MSGEAALLKPQYVRLSGEVADQALLDNLRAVYPNARIAHAFASTEAGVAFDVNDGLAGFPLDFIDNPAAEIELKVLDHTLRIRSGRNAARYLGATPGVLVERGWLCRYRRHGRARGRAILFQGPQGRRHQRRRPKGVSGRSRVGVERRSPGAHVPGSVAAQSHHRRGRGRRRGVGGSDERGCRGRAGSRQERTARYLPPRAGGPQGAGDVALRACLGIHGGRQAGAAERGSRF